MTNPFAPLNGQIKGQLVSLRPVGFDSDDYNGEYRKPDGNFIRPVLAITTCPICAALIEQQIPADHDLSQPIPTYCDTCHPFVAAPPPPPFPFRDPIEGSVLTLFQINPTALTNVDILFGNRQNHEPEIVVEPESPLVERRSEGLGQFMRKRDQWKPDGELDEVQGPREDIFDLMGQMSESFKEPPIEPFENDPTK